MLFTSKRQYIYLKRYAKRIIHEQGFLCFDWSGLTEKDLQCRQPAHINRACMLTAVKTKLHWRQCAHCSGYSVLTEVKTKLTAVDTVCSLQWIQCTHCSEDSLLTTVDTSCSLHPIADSQTLCSKTALALGTETATLAVFTSLWAWAGREAHTARWCSSSGWNAAVLGLA